MSTPNKNSRDFKEMNRIRTEKRRNKKLKQTERTKNASESRRKKGVSDVPTVASSSNSIPSSSGIVLTNSPSVNPSNNSITAVMVTNNGYNAGSNESDTECNGVSSTNLSDSTADLVKKNFFDSLPKSGDDTLCIPVQNKTLPEIKAELIRLFLNIQELRHSVIGQNAFRLEYKNLPCVRSSSTVKFQVDILTPPNQRRDSQNSINCSEITDFYIVQFTLISGPPKRFRRLFEHFSTVLLSSQMPSTSSVFPRKISSQLSFNSEEAQDMQMSDQLTTLSFSPSNRIRSRKSDSTILKPVSPNQQKASTSFRNSLGYCAPLSQNGNSTPDRKMGHVGMDLRFV
uniref:Uncharacterized protein n=1 Tax=Meloidogyne javanica TaxID=6303 RepID=A0A915MJ75_MELJA